LLTQIFKGLLPSKQDWKFFTHGRVSSHLLHF
jgi:hypothetical protein